MKIYIIGSVGSGKTTLAQKLASRLSLPHYETDNFVWNRHPDGDVRNSIEIRNALFHKAIKQSTWIIEGVHTEWTQEGFQEAEHIIFIDTRISTRKVQILKRFLKQVLGQEHSNYKPTFTILRNMYAWNNHFEYEMKPKLLQTLRPYKEKLEILKSNKQVGDVQKIFVSATERMR
ncbi:DNA topology modulation protein FlaR [Sporosarcina sp. FA9]|uniref:DNA topology modulation protein FlaR n=1 Tax=Sporosarcina sp. FA9 TaxID=3413030 RepID=UPI003F65A6BC